MEIYYSFSILIVIATLFAYINNRFLKLPSTIGIMVITIIFSMGLVIVGQFVEEPLDNIYHLIRHINFTQVLMGGMLNFLLFAGAIHISLKDLREEKMPIIVLSSLSVIISTFVVGFALYYLLGQILPMVNFHHEIPLIYCLLFGALISPTDPVAVLGILKEARVSKHLESKVAGESLFNDGVAVVLFTLLFNIAQGIEAVNLSISSVSWLLVKEVVGGLGVGMALGVLAWYGMRTASDYKISVLITLSVVMGGYLIATAMDISGPLTMVAAGLYIGDKRRKGSQAGNSKFKMNSNVDNFWELLDDILNAVLFLFIGLEILLIPDLNKYWMIGLIAIVVVLFARYISIKVPTILIPFKEKFSRGTMIILVWGGLRGGVSIALALSLPQSPYKDVIIAATYFVVVFSIIVQGLSIGKLAKRIKM